MLAELAVRKQSRKAHDVQVFLSTVDRILVHVEELVVIDVTCWVYCLVQLPNGVRLETGYILGSYLCNHFPGCTIANFNDFFGRVVVNVFFPYSASFLHFLTSPSEIPGILYETNMFT